MQKKFIKCTMRTKLKLLLSHKTNLKKKMDMVLTMNHSLSTS
jgi:hypothetical protein